MKISSLGAINSINNNINIEKKDKNLNTKKAQYNQLMSNSLSEVIGRSQVSFAGDNRLNGSKFEHSCNVGLGGRDNISYNKDDGSFIHTITKRDGSLVRQEEFYPSCGKEVITSVDNDNVTTVKTTMPNESIVEKFDSRDRQIYKCHKKPNGDKLTEVSEYDKKRKIITFEPLYGTKKIQVIDLNSNMPVTSGDIVYQKTYDKKTGEYITANIINGDVIQRLKNFSNGRLEYQVDYSPVTGRPTHQKLYDDSTGGYQEVYYYENGAIKSLTNISKNQRIIDDYTYGPDGKTELSHVERELNSKGEVKYKTEFYPNTDLIKTQIANRGSVSTVYHYNKRPNIKSTAEVYNNGFLEAQYTYHSDGETYRLQTQYKQDGSKKVTSFHKDGVRDKSSSYKSNGFLYKEVVFDPYSDEITKIVDYSEADRTIKETYFDLSTGLPEKYFVDDIYGNHIEAVLYYQGTENVKAKRVYNYDQSYTQTDYTEEGHVKRKKEYYADGTEKTARRNNYNYDYNSYYSSSSSSSTKNTNSKKVEEPEMELQDFLDHILDISSRPEYSPSSLTQKEWERFAEFVGAEDVEALKNMDQKTYKILAKRYHPDIQPPEEKEFCEQIFKILVNLKGKN